MPNTRNNLKTANNPAGFAEHYFSRQKYPLRQLQFAPSGRLKYIVVIPAFCEPRITDALDALYRCARPEGDIEVIVVINYPEKSSALTVRESAESEAEVLRWTGSHEGDSSFRTAVINLPDMPSDKAGVGYARKAGMDAALYRFNIIGNEEGLILSFDADCTCDGNYFTAIVEHSRKYPSADGFNIYFEHPFEGSECSSEEYKAIVQYELHLRYLNMFTRYTGFPYAYHTIGSSFAVKAGTYARQGGMNCRKAGEDFYFLHKVIPLGRFYEINDTRVIPSPRKSERVPFGTGAAIGRMLDSPEGSLKTYAPESFIVVKSFFSDAEKLYKADAGTVRKIVESAAEPLRSYLDSVNASESIDEINMNCRSMQKFIQRFFRWFNAFYIIKYLNFAARNTFPSLPVSEAAIRFLKIAGYKIQDNPTDRELLDVYREAERKQEFPIHQL